MESSFKVTFQDLSLHFLVEVVEDLKNTSDLIKMNEGVDHVQPLMYILAWKFTTKLRLMT